MRATLTSSIALAILLLMVVCSQAQEPNSAGVTDLRKQIQELAAIERNDATPPEVKLLNRKFIRERQVRLRLLLEQRIGAMNKYQASVSAIVAPAERVQIQEVIRDLEKEMNDLDREMSDSPGPGVTGEATSAESGRQPISPDVAPSDEPSSRPANDSVPVASHAAGRASAPLPTQDNSVAETTGGEAEQKLRDEVELDKRRVIAEVGRDVRGQKGVARATAARVFSPNQNPTAYGRILSYGLTMNVLPRAQFNSEIESARVDKQVGGAASNAGSTSLVSKGSVPAILGFAVENGGLTRTGQGTTLTFRGNLVGLVDALTGKGFINSFEDDSLTTRRLRKFSFALSYDTSLGDTPNVFVGNRQQLSSYSFRYEFFNHRDPRDPRYASKWADLVRTNAQAVATKANIVQDLFLRDPSLRAWLEEAQSAIAAATDDNLENVVRAQFDNLEKVPLSANVKSAVTSFQTAFSSYRQKREDLLAIVANGPIFTVDYVNNRRPGLIDTSNIKFIYSTGVFEGRASWTVNGDATFFNSHPGAGMSRFRDYDFSTQIDVPLGDPRGFGQFDLSFAGQIKRMAEDEVVNGVTVATKGNIGTFNLKLDIPIKNLGIKFPLALTYSNRTEFDFKKQLRANFGFAFDPDTLYNLLKPFGR